MTNCDKEFLTIDKTGILDENENGELTLYIELKDFKKEYNVLKLLKKMIGSTVQIKSVNEE